MNAWYGFDVHHLWHPYTQHATAPAPTPIARARGAYLYDPEGRAILDAISSWWVTLHGHAEPSIAEAVAEQARTLEQVIFAGFTHEPAARLAAELVSVLPEGLERVFLSDNGSTAVEVALKMAIQFWSNRGEKRPLIAALENAYHGDTFGAMSVSGRGLFTEPFGEHLWEVARLPDPTEGDTVAALGMYPETVLHALRERTAAHEVLLIADEVLTGFGRTGPLFACGTAAIRPDIVCLSKGLTGGFLPLSR